jgi:hypothetical protein
MGDSYNVTVDSLVEGRIASTTIITEALELVQTLWSVCGIGKNVSERIDSTTHTCYSHIFSSALRSFKFIRYRKSVSFQMSYSQRQHSQKLLRNKGIYDDNPFSRRALASVSCTYFFLDRTASPYVDTLPLCAFICGQDDEQELYDTMYVQWVAQGRTYNE